MNVSGAGSGTNTDAAQRAAAMASLDGADRQWPDPRAATGVMPVSNEAYFHPQYATLMREQFGIGCTAPDIAGVDLDGVTFKLSDYKGKVIFLDFWGDW